jgi:hypothetical protein
VQNGVFHCMLLEVPKNITVHEFSTSWVWFDEDGIMYSSPKLNAQQSSKEETMKNVDHLLELSGGKKVCIILESSSRNAPPPKEERDVAAEQLERITKAMAILRYLLRHLLAECWRIFFLVLNRQSIP